MNINYFLFFIIDGSPTRDRSPEPAIFSGLFSSGADMLRRKLVGPTDENDRPSRMSARNQVLLSRQEKRALRSLRLLEKVESLGLDNMMSSAANSFAAQQRGISPLAMHQTASASAGFRNRTASPMTQLTSLKTGSGHNQHLYGGGSSDEEPTRNSAAAFRSALSVSESFHSLSDSEGSTTSSSAPVAAPAKTSPPSRRPTSIGVTKPETPAKDKTTSPTEARLKQMQRQKSRRALVNGQRPDLGTVGGKVRPDLGRVAPPTVVASDYEEPAPMTQQHQTMTQSFVGTLSSLFFGRKGGLL